MYVQAPASRFHKESLNCAHTGEVIKGGKLTLRGKRKPQSQEGLDSPKGKWTFKEADGNGQDRQGQGLDGRGR
jgi:hypothetical protein